MVVILAPKCSSYLRIAAGTTEMGRKSDVVGEGCRGLYRWAPSVASRQLPQRGSSLLADPAFGAIGVAFPSRPLHTRGNCLFGGRERWC